MTDSFNMDETLIPPLLELDTIYYYIMGKEGDSSASCGEIKTIDIIDVILKDNSKSKSETGHALIIDTGAQKLHLNSPHRFLIEQWNEAIGCSMQTAREMRLSITGTYRNISKLLKDFDKSRETSSKELEKSFQKKMPLRASAYRDIDKLIEAATELKNDIIYLTDSAMAQSP